MNSRIFASAALVLSSLTVTACNDQSQEAAEAPDGIAGLSLENVRLVLPAVAANPAAVYFDLSYEGDGPQTLAAVSVEGATMAMMHEYAEKDYTIQMVPLDKVELTKGAKVSFEPGGKHVMAMDVSPELTAGGKTEMTLTFATGDKQSVVADIRGAGEAR